MGKNHVSAFCPEGHLSCSVHAGSPALGISDQCFMQHRDSGVCLTSLSTRPGFTCPGSALLCYRGIMCPICVLSNWWTFVQVRTDPCTRFPCVRYGYPGVRMLGYTIISCFVSEASAHFPKQSLHFAFFLPVRKCCMGVGVRGQLWVSILAFLSVWGKASYCSALTPQGSWLWSSEWLSCPISHVSQGFWDCRCELYDLYMGTRDSNSVTTIAQQALSPLSHILGLHYAFLPVTERVLVGLQ